LSLRSTEGRRLRRPGLRIVPCATYAAVRLTGADLQARLATYDRIRDDLAAPGLRTLRGGTIGVNSDLNRQTSLGLGLAIDYALFIVTRYREELRRTDSGREALVRTMATAGRTVAFSGITVAIALGGLLFFPQVFLRSMGLGGMAVVLVDMLAALTVLPAVLALLGRRVDALRLVRRRTGEKTGSGRGAWYRLARSVMRRPVAYAVGSVVVLLALGAPFLGIRFGSADVRALPPGAEARTVSTTLDRDFAHGSLSPIDLVLTGGVSQADLRGYTGRLRGLPGVSAVDIVGTGGDATHVAVRTPADPRSSGSRDLVKRIRARPAPGRAYVGGQTAELTECSRTAISRACWASPRRGRSRRHSRCSSSSSASACWPRW
jgi:RND superfamily putative drug exporter